MSLPPMYEDKNRQQLELIITHRQKEFRCRGCLGGSSVGAGGSTGNRQSGEIEMQHLETMARAETVRPMQSRRELWQLEDGRHWETLRETNCC